VRGRGGSDRDKEAGLKGMPARGTPFHGAPKHDASISHPRAATSERGCLLVQCTRSRASLSMGATIGKMRRCRLPPHRTVRLFTPDSVHGAVAVMQHDGQENKQLAMLASCRITDTGVGIIPSWKKTSL
jgi:hypothetical protein